MSETPKHEATPLADRMRPATLSEFLGQENIVGENSFLKKAIKEDKVSSIIFWGPPGSGKTTLAQLISKETNAEYIRLSAVGSGVKELREVIKIAKENKSNKKKTILFIDEIHRWNKSQQDALLPEVEDGTIILIGATTENPSFEVISALLSRTRVLVLDKLDEKHIVELLKRALDDKERGLGKKNIKIGDKVLVLVAALSNGDARTAYNILDASVSYKNPVTEEAVKHIVQKPNLLYDQHGEEHYNIISALHKSMRGGDADAALYWLGRMLEGGEDPLYIARRLIRFASEDIGLANSLAMPQAIAAYEACHYNGMPECSVNLAQAVVYMAKSKKSNVLYTAYSEVQNDIRNMPNDPVPLHLRSGVTKLMKQIGYGKGYKYTPDFENPEDAKQEYLPERLRGKKYLPPEKEK